MKTTLDLDEKLLTTAKLRARQQGMTLRALVEEALRACLLPRPAQDAEFELVMPVVRDRAPAAVNVADRNALYDFMDEVD